MKRKVCVLFMVLGMLGLVGLEANAASIFLEPSGDLPSAGDFSLTVDLTTPFDLDAYISVPEAATHGGLFGAGFYIEFDGTVIGADSFTLQDPPFNTSWSIVDVQDDYVSCYAAMQMPQTDIYGDILIGTVHFSPVAVGSSSVTTRDYSAFPDFTFFDGVNFDDIVQFHGGTVTVVPIPSTLFLLGTGLAGLVGLRRRKR